MGMSAGGGGGDAHGAPKADINTTPLVDVMLVLLIIFMITAPLMADKIEVKLPAAPSEEEGDQVGPKVTLSIVDPSQAGNGKPVYYWDEQVVTEETLAARMKSEAERTQNKIRMKIRADKTLKYDKISTVLKLAKDNGIANVAFISEPAPK
jgi:biopolymer transport protein ExbD